MPRMASGGPSGMVERKDAWVVAGDDMANAVVGSKAKAVAARIDGANRKSIGGVVLGGFYCY